MQSNGNEKNYIMIFANRLKELRNEAKLSRDEVAQKLGVALSTYANWEQGRRCPNVYEIYKIIEIFEIEANELFEI